jgi:acyl dehydratase
MKGMILFLAGLGIVFLASAVQTYGTNGLGQTCRYPGPCFHPEWLATGIVLSAAAYIAWKVYRKRP